MTRNTRWNAGRSSLAALVAVFVLACAPAHAQVKPFTITGVGVAPMGLPLPGLPPQSHWSVGEATYLGFYAGDGSVQTDTAGVPNANGDISGTFGSGIKSGIPVPYVFIGEDGDRLACEYGQTVSANTLGTFELVPVPTAGPGMYMAYFVAEFVPLPAQSTGQFAGVTGGWVMYAVTEPFLLGSTHPIPYAWYGTGSLTFKNGKQGTGW